MEVLAIRYLESARKEYLENVNEILKYVQNKENQLDLKEKNENGNLVHDEIIKNISKKLSVKISRIGKIRPNNQKSLFIDEKGQHLLLKFSGYKHQF